MEKIAVFIDENGEIGSFTESAYVNMYLKKDIWEIEKKIFINMKDNKEIRKVRQAFLALTKELEDCKIVVAKNAFGIPYSIFYSEDFSIWDLDGEIEDILDYILIKETEHEKLEEEKEKEDLAKELGGGHYLIDLMELELLRPELSSKMIIRPFFETKDFTKLDIKCCHVPPWIEKELKERKLKMKVKEIRRNEYNVILEKESV